MAYSIEIDGTPVKHKVIGFTKKHPSEDCDEFNAIIDGSATVNQFSTAVIKTGSTILFCGLVETINPIWDEKQSHKQISGRCHKVYLWKKFTERFERGNIDGFFGAVSPSKLARLLLRCPISDDPSSSVFHRIGYGFDLNGGKCVAIRRDEKTHPEWCRLRHTGFCWRLDGHHYGASRYVDAYVQDQREWIHNCDTVAAIDTDLFVNGWTFIHNDWTHVNNSPWLHNEDGDGDYISMANLSANEGDYDEYYDFANLTYDFIDDITVFQIKIKMKVTDATANACVRIWIKLSDGGSWIDCGAACTNSLVYTWLTVNVPVAYRENLTIAELNYCRLKLEYDQCVGAEAGATRITAAKIHIEGSYGVTWNDVDDPWLDDCSDETEWVEGRVVGRVDSYWTFEDIPNPTDTDGVASSWRDHTVGTCDLKIRGKNVTGAAGGVTITPYIWDGAWQQLSNLTWSDVETNYVTKTIDVKSILNTVAKINGARLKLLFSGSAGDFIRITCAYLTVEIDESDYQRTGDWFKVDLGGSKTRVTGILIESRYSNDKYAVNYEIQTSPDDSAWTTRAGPVTNNNIRDIIESWSPVTCRYVRIRITNDAGYGWEVSQVFIWQSDDASYDINGDGTDLTIGAVGSANFADYGNTIDPTSFGFQRLNEAFNHICEIAHASYTPWEWWVIHNAAHDFCFKQKRGTDRSGTVIFERSKHIKSINVEYTNRGTVQRVKYIGRGEGKSQDEIASDWQVNAGGIGEVNTFYEKVISEKSSGDKTQADTLANVYATQFGQKRVELIVTLSRDPWEGTYEVGDEIKIIDTLLGINAKFRLTVIERTITNEPTNETTLTLTNSWYDVADLYAELKRELRNVGLTGTVVADWRGEGGKQDEIDSAKMTKVWAATSNNEEIEPPPETDDSRWNNQGDGEFSQGFACDKDVFAIRGSKRAGFTEDIRVWLLRDDETTTGWLDFDQNPRFVTEVKIRVHGSDPAEGTDWYNGDYAIMGMFSGTIGAIGSGFGFRIVKVAAGYELYTYFRDSTPPDITVKLADLTINTKYRLEVKVDWDERLVKWYVNKVLTAILAFSVSEDGNNTNMFAFNTYLSTTNPDPVTHWAYLYIYSYRAEAGWES